LTQQLAGTGDRRNRQAAETDTPHPLKRAPPSFNLTIPTIPFLHTPPRAERRRLSHYESIDYLPPNSTVYRKWLGRQVGVAAGAVAADGGW